MSSFKRNAGVAALWVLRQAARRLAEETAKRQQSGAGAGSTYPPAHPGTGQPYRPASEQPSSAAGTGSAYRASEERPSWSSTAGPRANRIPERAEDLARRVWPYLDTPANRERVARFVERMRTAPGSRR